MHYIYVLRHYIDITTITADEEEIILNNDFYYTYGKEEIYIRNTKIIYTYVYLYIEKS